jgi:hypothetical protein
MRRAWLLGGLVLFLVACPVTPSILVLPDTDAGPDEGEGEGDGAGDGQGDGEGEGAGPAEGEGEGDGPDPIQRRWPLGLSTLQISDGTALRPCTMVTPEAALARLPALMLFHAPTVTAAEQIELLGLANTSEQLDVLVIACDGVERTVGVDGQQSPTPLPWDPYNAGNRDFILAQAMRAELVAGNVDDTRIAVSGLLQGGYMAFALITDQTQFYSTAIIINAGDPGNGPDSRIANITRPFRFDIVVSSQLDTASLEAIRASRTNLLGRDHIVLYSEVDGPVTTSMPVVGASSAAQAFYERVDQAVRVAQP